MADDRSNVVTMHKIVLALALREDDRRKRLALCAFANFCKINFSRRASAQLRSRQNAMLMHLMAWYKQRTSPDGLYDQYESVIQLYIRKASPEKFRAAFRVSREIFEAILRAISPFIKDGKSRNSSQNVTASHKLGIALYYMAHGMDGDGLDRRRHSETARLHSKGSHPHMFNKL